MAEKVGDAYVELGTRNVGLDTGLNRGLQSVKSFAIAASAIFAGVAAGRGVSGLIGAYSDAEETINKFNEVFNGSTQDINKAADELAASYGLIGTSSRKLLADTGDILVGFGFTEDAALDLAVQTQKLAIDLASFTNIEGGSAKASQALTKALVGETEQAKALGIVIRQLSPEFLALVKNYTEVEGKTLLQAKALAALDVAVSQTKKAQGDYARTQDQLANQMRLTGERTKALKEATGGLLAKFLNAGEGVLNFNNALEKLAGTLNGVTTAEVKTTQEVVLLTAGIVGAYKALQILIPLFVTLAAKAAALAASGGMLAAIGSASGFVAIAAGIGAITVQFIKMRNAMNESKESSKDLLKQQKEMIKTLGTSNPKVARAIRKAITSGNAAEIQELEFLFPKAFSKISDVIKEAGRVAAAPSAAAAKKEKAAPRDFAFGAFEDAIRTIQISLGKTDEQKKQTNILGNIDKGIQEIVKKPETAVVGV